MKSNKTVFNIIKCALFAALCMLGTCLIVVPLPLGYINIGDVFVLLTGWCLGFYGVVAGALGSALADLISGYVVYAPTTFAVKGLVALVCFVLYNALQKAFKSDKTDILARIISAIVAELVMIGGYFLFESILYGVATAAVNIVNSAIQASICIVLAVIVVSIMAKIRILREYFPAMVCQQHNKQV